MSSHNLFPGYVKLPGKELYDHEVRLDFNARIDSDPKRTKMEGFSLRLFTVGKSGAEQPEISVSLTTEQWLDLMDSMRAEFEMAQRIRKEWDEEL